MISNSSQVTCGFPNRNVANAEFQEADDIAGQTVKGKINHPLYVHLFVLDSFLHRGHPFFHNISSESRNGAKAHFSLQLAAKCDKWLMVS